jgi:putative SOS response-associated peptidase YedK
MLALAGIWSSARHEEPTAAILTTAPNALLAPVHDRMPVILPADALDAWLDPGTEAALIGALLAPADPAGLRMWPVSTAVNRVAATGPQLLEPIELAPTLGLA